MSTEIEKQTKITIGLDVPTFKWFQTIRITGVRTVYGHDVTFEIAPEAAKKILGELSYAVEISKSDSNRIDFHIK